MIDEKVLGLVNEKAQMWLSEAYDKDTRDEVKKLLEAEDKTPLVEAFYKDLEFGTGGLRGIMGAGSNRMNKYTVGYATQGLANYIIKANPNVKQLSVVIGYDCRHNSRFFADTAASIFSANGIKVYLFEALRPTPEISFAIRHLGCQSGVMVTASHNPKVYNGYKAYWSDGAQMVSPHDVNTIDEVNKVKGPQDVKWNANKELIQMIGEDVDKAFIDMVLSLSMSQDAIKKHHDIPIVYTPIHGTGSTIMPKAMAAFGFTNFIHVPEQDVISGDFPTVVSPNPEEPETLTLAMKRANETNAQLVLASDPDADRIAVAVRNNENKIVLLNGNEICTLLSYYSIIRRKEIGDLQPKDYLVKTIVTTELIRAIADKNEVKLFDCYTGFKWIADVIRKEEEKGMRYIGGGEESFGYLWESSIRDKSSISACCIFAEMAAWAKEKGMTIYQLMDKIYSEYGFYREKGFNIVREGRTGAEEIAEMMRNYRSNPFTHLAGSKVVRIKDFQKLEELDVETGKTSPMDMPCKSNVLQYFTADGLKLSVRPSGTEPKIKYYIGIKDTVDSVEQIAEARQTTLKKQDEIMKMLGM